MKIKLKNRIIDIFTFITHLFISLSYVGIGWFAMSWASAWNTTEGNLTIYYFIIFAGVILFFINLFMLFSHSFKSYIATITLTLISAITWIVVAGSMDVSNSLPFYIVIFIPLAFYKYKLNNNKNLHETTPR